MARIKIRQEFLRQLTIAEEYNNKLANNLTDLNRAILRIDRAFEDLANETPEEVAQKRLNERYGDKLSYISDEKLKEFETQLVAGIAPSRPTLGYTPEGVVIRPRTTQIMKEIQRRRQLRGG